MTTECCWPFCGADPKECDCADNLKKEVMPIAHATVERNPVAPPPVSEAGGDLRTNDEKTNMTDETCKENAEKLTVALPEPSCYYEGIPTAPLWEYKKMIAYGDERARAIAEDRNCWKSIADGEAELRAIADDELKVSEGRVAELESLLRMIATRAQNFPDFPIGWHIPEVFKAVGMQMPERPDTDDTHDGLRARVAELEAKLAEAEQRLHGIADHCRDIYAIVPSLPIEPETMESATDALHAFCLMLGIERIEIEPTYKQDAAIAAGGGDD